MQAYFYPIEIGIGVYSGPCAKGPGVLVGKTFQNSLNMTDE